jgi:hypothetical protein
MTIFEKVLEKKKEIKANPAKARENRDLAVPAIHAGISSEAWKKYMQQYAGTPKQLERLMATDGTLGDKDMDRRRAYLVSNAVCGSTTVDRFEFGVETIDEGL